MSNFLLRASQDDDLHQDAQRRTGFWGSRGAGFMLLSKSTGRYLLGRRSAHVDEPGTWGGWGGAVDSKETFLQGAKRELFEEAGIKPTQYQVVFQLYQFRKQDFKYITYLATCENEVRPKLTFETSAAGWFEFGDFPTPVHFGLRAIMQDARASKILRNPFHV